MKQFWFIGVTTGQSMIMRLFPIWAEVLGIQETRMHGVDLPPGVEGAKVREKSSKENKRIPAAHIRLGLALALADWQV